MSLINFESARVKEAEREEIRKAREAVLKKAEEEYNIRKQNKERTKLRGDEKWMLPSVEQRLKKESKKEKKHKKKKKKSKSKKRSSSSDSENSSEEEWVESNVKGSDEKEECHQKEQSENITSGSGHLANPAQRDEWMTLPGLFASVSKEELRQKSGKLNKAEQRAQKEKYLLDSLGQSDRELNPYWKDGGKGVPEEKPGSPDAVKLPEKTVGDQGADWLRRALKRAKEQAEEEGRSLEDVAAERWGSLKNLEKMLEEAESRSKTNRTHGQDDEKKKWYNRKDKRDNNERSRSDRCRTPERFSSHCRSSPEYRRHYSHRDSSDFNRLDRQRSFKEPSADVDIGSKPRRGFLKPEADDDYSRSSVESRECNRGGTGSWRKKDSSKAVADTREKPKESKRKKSPSSSSSSSSSESEKEEQNEKKNPMAVVEILTDQQMNDLGAKIVKAEILGDEGLAAQLKKKLEMAREARKKQISENKTEDNESTPKEEVVVLTKTNARGFSHPVKSTGPVEPVGGRRKKQKVETHVDGKRVRYFADDDKYSLQQMFEKEKLSTTSDENAMFAKLAGKGGSRDDMDDVFADEVRRKQSEGKIQTRDRWQAIQEHKKVEKALDSCHWCFDSKKMLKHLIVAIGNKVYLCLPHHQSLTEGHCFIVPMFHTSCATQLDEDVWNEMQTFRKTLVRMFQEKLDQDVVFFESAMHLNKFPHMLLECVPMPRETGDLAPIYFKKAILESESDWAMNKKVVDLKGKDVRRAVPKGLPYFAVDFGNDPGFAHVIENEKNFPRNFAQEIIGGMLELEHNLWRKPRLENFDTQRRKVVQFSHWWKPYDFTVKKKTDSSSDSD